MHTFLYESYEKHESMNPKVILDSGAYTAHKKGIVINIDEYASFVKKHSSEFAGCFNLDSIGNAKVSYENWIHLKEKGADTIPVYHIGTDEKYLVKYLEQTDYIGLGAIANLDTTQRMLSLSRIWENYLIDEQGYPKVKVHGLGLTAIPIMMRYPWYSVDSFTPVISAVWGSVLLPWFDSKGVPHFFNLFICRISDQGNHKGGLANSYPSLPVSTREKYSKMFEQYGFKLGEIAYQEKRPRRGKKDEIERKPKPMFDLIRPSDPEIKTLANSWEERMRWNLTIWSILRERLPRYPRKFHHNEPSYEERIREGDKTIMYMGVSTTTHMEIFSMIEPKLDILISYAYLTDSIHKMIKTYTR